MVKPKIKLFLSFFFRTFVGMKSKKLPFTEAFLLKQYKKDINDMLDACDWISYIEDHHMICTVADICRKKGMKIDTEALGKKYDKYMESLKLTNEQYRAEYADWETGVPKLMKIFYKILSE